MLYITASAIVFSLILYLAVGIVSGRSSGTLDDFLPIKKAGRSYIESPAEFSASTIAVSVSFATVILAFFELAPFFGLWLAWAAITTTAGIALVRCVGGRIWMRLEAYGSHRPSLHEFLGTEYSSAMARTVTAVCTSVGFILAFAVELSVGSRFLTFFIPQLSPEWLAFGMAGLVVGYTALGGFRAVVLADRLQMIAIWLMLLIMALFYAQTGVSEQWTYAQFSSLGDMSWRPGLLSFLIGVLVINVPSFVADMGVWQRITATNDQTVVLSGLVSSAALTFVSWIVLIILACFAPLVVSKGAEINLAQVLHELSYIGSLGQLGAFFCLVGFLGAALSTASTQLVAVVHSIQLDIIPARSRLVTVKFARISTLVVAMIALLTVELFILGGFSISELVFAIYGSQLSLTPPVILALTKPRDYLSLCSSAVTAAAITGFACGWLMAIVGRVAEIGDLIFLAPAGSLFTSAVILTTGVHLQTKKPH